MTGARPPGRLERLDAGVLLLRGGDLGCARLLRLLRDEIRGLPPGTEVRLETTDPVAPIDLPAWCRLTGHAYLGPVDRGDAPDGAVRFAVRLTDGARATDPRSPWRLEP